ncbi:MAG: hypothetical protein ABI853_01225 [Sphingomicrobium sp.]
MDDESEQQALFEIEGPDEDGCVWVCSPKGRGDWCQNLGPEDKVAEAMFQWLRSIGRYPDTQFWAPLLNQKN